MHHWVMQRADSLAQELDSVTVLETEIELDLLSVRWSDHPSEGKSDPWWETV